MVGEINDSGHGGGERGVTSREGRKLTALKLISGVTAVVVAVTLVLPGDAAAVLTQKLVLSGAVGR